MEESSRGNSTRPASPLYAAHPLRRAPFNRAFATVYAFAVLALLYRHTKVLLSQSSASASFWISLALLGSDLVLAFTWSAAQAVRLYPISRQEFPENLENVIRTRDFPALDVFICSADPYKEPPLSVVNTALSVMAYDYPAEKLSVFVSDDGGSALTLFAFMEAAKFAGHWLPFCRINNVVERCPKAFFESTYPSSVETDKIKIMYESMKLRIEHVVETGNVYEEYMSSSDEVEEQNAFSKLTAHGFTRQNHPAVIQVLLNNSRDKDIAGQLMPNLVYVSREKSETHFHHFKAGALNVLLRVSAVMTNAPIILTLDCDMYSNDSKTPLRALCYYSDPDILASYAFIQFPQRFKGINKSDIYAGEFKRLFQIQPLGYDGLMGSTHLGTCCFFSRRAFFGSPSDLVLPEIPELCPSHVVNKPIDAHETLALACQVAGCNYESKTDWGNKIGYRYGSLVEDYYTGYLLHCQGWRSMFCNPDRAAFLGDAPMSLVDMLSQHRRWAIGLLEVGFSKHSPLTHGVRYMGPLTGLAYSQYAFWPILSIPLTVYTFLPQLALFNDICILPKVPEPWFLLYMFLFLGSYGQDCLDFVLAGGTVQMWWNDQRFWHLKGVTSYLIGSVEFLLKVLGIPTSGFNVTSKVLDDEHRKRYEQGFFEFGVNSPMFVLITMAALINSVAFIKGLLQVSNGSDLEGPIIQLFIAGYGTINCWPVYEAMVLRNDEGKLPTTTTTAAVLLSCALHIAASFVLK